MAHRINTYYEADQTVVIEVAEAELALSREEAEQLFVVLGHTLMDMDISEQLEQTDSGEQPDA